MTFSEHACRLHRRIINPGERGILLAVCRALLRPPAAVYGLAARLRNRAYDRGWKTVHRAAAPVISVGNITAGGTGKTPFVAWLCERLISEGIRPAILSRGYGADEESGVDDENQMLHELAPGAPIVVDPDRVAGADRALNRHRAEVLVMDDGFQHRRLHRDFDLVLIDALLPFGGGHMLPRGLLREPVDGLRRADAVVITRADQVGEEERENLHELLRRHAGQAPVACADHVPVGLAPAGEGPAPDIQALREGRWGAFCGLGNPEGFRRTLRDLGTELEFFRVFPDHHAYRRDEVETLQRRGLERRCRGLLTTEKDAIKLRSLPTVPSALEILTLQVRMEVGEGKDLLWRAIHRVLDSAATQK